MLLPLLFVLMLVGCASIEESISKEEAKQLVITHHTNENGVPEIISIEIKNNRYRVEWENKENVGGGIDKVAKNGEVKMIEAYIH